MTKDHDQGPLKIVIGGEKTLGPTLIYTMSKKRRLTTGLKWMKDHVEIPHGLKWIMVDGHLDFTTRDPNSLPYCKHYVIIKAKSGQFLHFLHSLVLNNYCRERNWIVVNFL
jgi:hypothetical protein